MRESVGGAWLFGIVALFIALFSGFIAYAISYTKAFKVKNEIVNIIEKSEGFTLFNPDNGTGSNPTGVTGLQDLDDCKSRFSNHICPAEGQAYLVIQALGYNTASVDDGDYGTCYDGGYCIDSHTSKNKNGTRINYKVTTFIKITIPVLSIDLRLPISGETKSIYVATDDEA